MARDIPDRRNGLRQWLGLQEPEFSIPHQVTATSTVNATGRSYGETAYERRSITFRAPDGDSIPAFLLVPARLDRPAPAIVIHHQHNGERHLGKSEVCGLAGDSLQAFGPALAARGIVVLAPDSIGFEDRRAHAKGTAPHDDDWVNHYNEMTYRLVRGDTLMRKVLADAEAAVSVLAGLAGLDMVDPSRIGLLGHSYGGNTVMFQAALDERVAFACSSGAVCSYRDKMRRGTSIEMAEVLPGVIGRLEVDELLRLAAPRRLLVVSADDDPYSHDADEMIRLARPPFPNAADEADAALVHHRYQGKHAMTRERFDRIIDWIDAAARR